MKVSEEDLSYLTQVGKIFEDRLTGLTGLVIGVSINLYSKPDALMLPNRVKADGTYPNTVWIPCERLISR